MIKATDCGGNGARAASGAWERAHRHRCLNFCWVRASERILVRPSAPRFASLSPFEQNPPLQSASGMNTQICSQQKLTNEHANATDWTHTSESCSPNGWRCFAVMTSAQRSDYRPKPTDNVGHVFSTKVAKLACELREGLADIGRQAAEEMPTHVAKRPNTSRTAARAGVEGRHLPDGSAEWRQPRFRNFPRGAWRPEEHGPFLGPNPSIQNHRGSEARRSYSAPQLEYHLTYKPLEVRKAPQSSWVRAGSPRAGPLGTGPCTRRPLNTRNMHSGSPPFFAELVRGTPLGQSTVPRMVGEAEGVAVVNRR